MPTNQELFETIKAKLAEIKEITKVAKFILHNGIPLNEEIILEIKNKETLLLSKIENHLKKGDTPYLEKMLNLIETRLQEEQKKFQLFESLKEKIINFSVCQGIPKDDSELKLRIESLEELVPQIRVSVIEDQIKWLTDKIKTHEDCKRTSSATSLTENIKVFEEIKNLSQTLNILTKGCFAEDANLSLSNLEKHLHTENVFNLERLVSFFKTRIEEELYKQELFEKLKRNIFIINESVGISRNNSELKTKLQIMEAMLPRVEASFIKEQLDDSIKRLDDVINLENVKKTMSYQMN